MAGPFPDPNPYPEPAAPPEPPREDDPIQAPLESPPAQPFGDTGQPVDHFSTSVAA